LSECDIALAKSGIYDFPVLPVKRRRRPCVCGIIGLCTLIGIILYIGAITEEAGNKGKSSMDGPSFQYWYGASFVLTVLSFTTAELTGVQAVYLYISRHKHAYRKKVKRLANSSSGTGLEQHQLSGGGPLVNDPADVQGPVRGGSQRGG